MFKKLAEKIGVGLGRLFKDFVANLGLMFIPYPIGVFSKKLAGNMSETGDMEMYRHPPFVVAMHLVFVGWLVALGVGLNTLVGAAFVPVGALSWLWVGVLFLTLLMLGFNFNRAGLMIFGLSIALILAILFVIKFAAGVPIFGTLFGWIGDVPVGIQWGLPAALSFLLGATFVGMATWQRIEDVWEIKKDGDFLEHRRFGKSDISINKGAKTFREDTPCLLKYWLCFGYANINVTSHSGKETYNSIDGVLHARAHAELIKRRFKTSDVSAVVAETEAAAEVVG